MRIKNNLMVHALIKNNKTFNTLFKIKKIERLCRKS